MSGFRVLSQIDAIEQIAAGRAIRERQRLVRSYGAGNWRKMKGVATVELAAGPIRKAELHWYEAHGVGKKEFKIKRLLD